MSTPSSHLPPTIETDRTRSVRLAPLSFWLIGQLAVLAMGAGRVALTARAGEMPQHLALPEMIAFQLGSCAMAFPWLLSVGNRVAVMVSGLLFIHLAAALHSTATPAEFWTVIGIAMWLTVMMRTSVSPPTATHTVATVLATTLIVGSPILNYLIADFGTAGDRSIPILLNPIGALIVQSRNPSPQISTHALPTILLIGKIIFARRLARSVES